MWYKSVNISLFLGTIVRITKTKWMNILLYIVSSLRAVEPLVTLTFSTCSMSVQRAQSELAAHQKKILHVDNHIGISIAGLTADARLLWWVRILWWWRLNSWFNMYRHSQCAVGSVHNPIPDSSTVTSCVRSVWTPDLSSTDLSPHHVSCLLLAAVSFSLWGLS